MRKHKVLTVLLIVSLMVVAVLGSLFLLRANHYKTHLFPGTVMCGVDVSEMTAEQATEKVGRFVSDYLLTISCREDKTYHIQGPDIGYAYVPNGEIEAILTAQNEYDWIRQMKNVAKHEIELSTVYDPELLRQVLAQQEFMQPEQMVSPEDAKIDWVEDHYELIPEVMGTTLDFDRVYQAVQEAVSNGETELDVEELYDSPQVREDDPALKACMDNIDNYFGTSITYTFGKQDPYLLTSGKIQSWLTVDDKYQVSVDDEQVTRFVQQMASTYNTYGDVREFQTNFGDKIKIGGGDYGWVIDKEKEKAQIYEDLAAGGAITREPVYSQTARKHGANDVGSTYVEIDYTNQHLWYYEKGKTVLDTDIVSGNLRRNNGSPDGVFKIVYKQRDATLVGEGYSSPVKYFMPFAYNVGIHDASWRRKFGEEIYLTAGSHGCINVPPEIAEQLFGIIEVGTPVVAYYREPVYLTAENARISNAYSYIDEKDYKELLKKKPAKVKPKKNKNNN